jgi:hypothetical protein
MLLLCSLTFWVFLFEFESISDIRCTCITNFKKFKILNYRRVLQNFSIDGLKVKPPDCYWHNSPLTYSHSDVITGDLLRECQPLFFSLCSFSGIILHLFHKKFEIAFPIYVLWLTIFWILSKNFKEVLSSFWAFHESEDYDLPLLYWIPKLQCPYKKKCLQKYHNTCFSRIGVNLMWILQSSKILLETKL